jgi:hypothetical protein
MLIEPLILAQQPWIFSILIGQILCSKFRYFLHKYYVGRLFSFEFGNVNCENQMDGNYYKQHIKQLLQECAGI